MGQTAQFVAGLAQMLEDQGVGAWRPDNSPYLAAEVAIVPGFVPAQPDRLIVITPYLPVDDPTEDEGSEWVQFRTRGPAQDFMASQDLQDAIFAVFQNLPRTVIGGVTVAGCWRRSGAHIGVDANQRHEHTSNYEFRVHRPTPNRH